MTSNPLVRHAGAVARQPSSPLVDGLVMPGLADPQASSLPTVRPSQPPVLARRGAKSAEAFRTISEVAAELDVPQHVLRFWETKFAQIHPLKRGGGRRYYRPDDMALLRTIHKLLHQDGYTIKGVQRLLKEGGRSAGQIAGEDLGPAGEKADPQEGGSRSGRLSAELAPSAGHAMLDLFEGAEDGGGEDEIVPLLPILSSEKRALLKSVLAELEELRALIPGRFRSSGAGSRGSIISS